MIYGGVITTPANTAASSPQDTEVTITAGLVYHLKVYFPPGPSGLLYVQVFDASYQVFPTTIGEAFVGDNILLEFDELYDKSAAPYILIVRTWNLDDTYEHHVLLLMSLASREEYQARYLPSLSSNMLVQALGEQEAAKELERSARVERFLKATAGAGG